MTATIPALRPSIVIAGLVPAISLILALPCQAKRDARVKPAHDESISSVHAQPLVLKRELLGELLAERIVWQT